MTARVFTKRKFAWFSLLLVLTHVGVACKNGDLGFQNFTPKSETALADLFNNTPAIRAAFTTISPHEFNTRLDNLIRTDPVMGVKSMHAMGALSKDRPALPQLADSVSSIIDRFARYYQATETRKAEYNSAIDLVNRLLDIDPKAVTDGTFLMARALKYIGESNPLFYISATHPDVTRVDQYKYPALSTWQTCDDPGSVFLNSKPDSDVTDFQGRDNIWALYDVIRTGFCIYANRTGPRITITGVAGGGATAEATVSNSIITAITVTNPGSGYPNDGTTLVSIDASPGPGSGAVAVANVVGGQVASITITAGGSGYVPKSDNSPGAFMRNATATLKNSGDIELRVRNIINDLQNKLDDYSTSEKKIADWTVNQSNIIYQSQVAVTDFLIDYVFDIIKKDFVFNLGKEVLDREAEHLAMPNPGGTAGGSDEFLTQWLLQALYNDAPKMDDLENFSNIDTTSRLYVFGKDIVESPIYGIRSVFSPTRYVQPKLKGKIWSGSSYTCNCTPAQPATIFQGLLFQDGAAGYTGDGYLSRLAQVQSTEVIYNPYRNFMSPRIGSLVTVPSNYGGEFYLEAALKNFYYHVLDRYYDQANLQWALTAEDAQTSFGDPERNLQGYIGQMQYSMRNMARLDRVGKQPGDAGFNNVPYLTEFLYTIAAANGYVDPVNAPAQLTLQTCLYSMGSTDIAADGIRTIGVSLGPITLPDMNSQVTNMALPADGIAASSRNNEYYSSSLGMFAFELLSPGRFIPRTDTEVYAGDLVNGKFRGRFSPHQGDIESTGLKTSNWMVAEFSLSAWEGYGPYSVKGRAANGSSVKYENDYFTDGFKSRIMTGPNSPGDVTETAMGTNGGNGGGTVNGNGNYHIYERIYRPRNSGDPCWALSQGSTYGYARYGFIRPENNTSYWDVSNCASWTMERIDFDTRDEAIRANVEWNLKYKKYIFVIPMYGFTNMWTLWDNGASFAVFSTIHGNGLWGVTTGKRACGTANCNGRWNVAPVNMSANGQGYVPNSGNGFITEASAGGQPGVTIVKTIRPGVQSYTAGDSMVLMETSFFEWGLTGLLVNVFAQIWDSLGDGPVTPAMIKDNFDSVLTLANALYTQADVLNGTQAAHFATPSMANFRVFFDTFFPTDETTCTGGVLTYVANATADLYENYLNGCGVTARDLPPIPKVNPNTTTCNEFGTAGCLKYPNTFDATTGAVTSWYAYTGPSEGKLTGMLTPLIMLFGTMHEDGTVMKITSYPSATPMAANENRDSVAIRNFCAPGYPGCPNADLGFRVELDTLFTALASLNETVMFNSGGANNNLPQYNATALTNMVTESGPGLRNGLMPKLTNNKYANVAYIDPLVRDIESLISDNVRKAEDNFDVTSGTVGAAAGFKNKDRLRYLATKNVVNPTLTPTILISTPGIFSLQYHGLEIGDKVYFTTTGSLPTGLTASNPATSTYTYYYVVGPITRDNFKLSATYGGAALNTSGTQSGVHTLYPPGFKSNRFDQSVNGVALNSIPINMMKQFVGYLRTLTADADIVAAIKAAIPVINNYLANVQGSSTQITLTNADIDKLVGFIKDTNKTGQFSVDSFLDMIVSTKMDDLNTLRSFNFNQFKTLGSYQSVFDDMNDKVYKYFDVDVKKDILYSSLMLGEPTCPGGSANGFYDHNKDGVWNAGTFTFISAAYTGAQSYIDTANVGGSCAITRQIPNIYDKDYYMFDMGGVARNIYDSITTLTVADIDRKLKLFYGRTLTGAPSDVIYGANPDNGNKVECYVRNDLAASPVGIMFDNEITAQKNLLLCKMYNTKIAEPHYDRNGNGTIEAGEYTDINYNAANTILTPNGSYDDENSATAVNLRNFVTYYLENVFMPKYDEFKNPDPLSPNKNYISFAAQAIRDLLAPTLCDPQGLNCSPNSNYVTQDLVAARATFFASVKFDKSELKSVKNVIGNFLYDQDTGAYTELIKRTGPSIVTFLREFQGDYNDLLTMGLEGFKPDGFMTYFSTNLKNKAPYTSLDILTDVRTLFNTQVMRCYPGITQEYYGGPSYCKKYKGIDTFWGQFGLLMDQFSTSAYNKYKAQWQGQMTSPYYARLKTIFE